jgi:hypothetical protein
MGDLYCFVFFGVEGASAYIRSIELDLMNQFYYLFTMFILVASVAVPWQREW